MKEVFLFAQFANRNTDARNSLNVDAEAYIPTWTPGLLVSAIPGQPSWLFNFDITFQANLWYIFGSLIFVMQALWYEHSFGLPGTRNDDYNPQNPSNYLNALGAMAFVINALLCFMDWFLCKQSLHFLSIVLPDEGLPAQRKCNDGMEMQAGAQSTTSVTPLLFRIQQANQRILTMYFWNNVFFMVAALIYLIQGVFLSDHSVPGASDCLYHICNSFYLPFWGAVAYLVSSLFSIAEYYENNKLLKMQRLPLPQMFRCGFMKMDWDGWGDWIYLWASILPVCTSCVNGFYPFTDDAGQYENAVLASFYLADQLLFLLDSIAYMLGYIVFMVQVVETMRERQRALHEDGEGGTKNTFVCGEPGEPGMSDGPYPDPTFVKNSIMQMHAALAHRSSLDSSTVQAFDADISACSSNSSQNPLTAALMSPQEL